MKKLIIILICVVFSQEVYAVPSYCGITEENFNSISDNVELKSRNVTVIVHYFEDDKEWAEQYLNFASDALPLLEEIAGFPYSRRHDVEIFIVEKDMIGGIATGVERGICGIWITKNTRLPEEYNNTLLAHEISHLWADYNIVDKVWLAEGFADLYAYLVLLKMNRTYDAKLRKAVRFFDYSDMKPSHDFPLDEFENSEDYDNMTFGYGKSMVFMYLIYKIYGIETLQQINQNLKWKDISPNSTEYKEAMEEVIGHNLDNLFSGWIFEGEYKVGVVNAGGFSESYDDAMNKLISAIIFSEKNKNFVNTSCIEDNLENARLEFNTGHYNKSIEHSTTVIEKCGIERVGATVGTFKKTDAEDVEQGIEDHITDDGSLIRLIIIIFFIAIIIILIFLILIFLSSGKKYTWIKESDYPNIPENAVTVNTRENVRDLVLWNNRVIKCDKCGSYYSERGWKLCGKCIALDCRK